MGPRCSRQGLMLLGLGGARGARDRNVVQTAMLCIAVCTLVSGCHLFDLLGTGSERSRAIWHIVGRAIGTPATDGAEVFFNDGSHEIVAVDAETGAQRWRAATDSTLPVPLAPSCVLVAELVACGDDDVFAFARDDGRPVWRYHATRGYGPGHFPLVSNNGIVYAGSAGIGALGTGTMYALDGASGVPLWVAAPLADDTNGVNITGLSVDGDIVVGAVVRGTKPLTGGVVALDAGTGAVRWITSFPQAAPDSTSAGISTALWQGFVLGSSTDGKIYLLDRQSGAIRSFFPGIGIAAPAPGGNSRPYGEDFRQLRISGSTLYAASFGSWLVAYDLERRVELWRAADSRGSSNASPIVIDGDAVYIVELGGSVSAFSARAPKRNWTFGDLNSTAFLGSVAVGTDRLFLSAVTGFWAIRK